MKKQIIYILSSMLLSSVFFSCSTPATMTTSTSSEYKMRTADYKEQNINKNEIYQKPLVADLEVSKEKVFFSRTYENMTVDQAKENVTGEFILEQGCDILVQPLYQTETTISDSKSTIVVSVSGYPAFYKNIRTYAPGDDEAFLIKSLIGSVKTPTVDKPNTSVAVNEVVEKVQEVKTVKKNTKGLFAIGIEASRPMGDFSTYNKLGLGAYTKLGLKLSKGVALYTDLSYLSYGGKTYTETSYDYYGYPHYYTNKYSSISIFRYLGGLDINLTKGLYGTLQGGMCSITEKDGSSSIKTNAFNWSIGIGYTVSKFDVGLLYNSMLNSDWEKPLNSLGLRLGFKL